MCERHPLYVEIVVTCNVTFKQMPWTNIISLFISKTNPLFWNNILQYPISEALLDPDLFQFSNLWLDQSPLRPWAHLSYLNNLPRTQDSIYKQPESQTIKIKEFLKWNLNFWRRINVQQVFARSVVLLTFLAKYVSNRNKNLHDTFSAI